MHGTPSISFERQTRNKLIIARDFTERRHFHSCIETLRDEVRHGGALRGRKEAHILYLEALLKAAPIGARHMREEDIQAYKRSNIFEAQYHLDGLHENTRGGVSYTLIQARLHAAQERHTDALKLMESLLKNKEERPILLRRSDVVLFISGLYGHFGQPAKGLKLITDSIKAYAKNGNYAPLLLMKARLFEQNGEVARAIKFIEAKSEQYGPLRFDDAAGEMIARLEALPPQKRPHP